MTELNAEHVRSIRATPGEWLYHYTTLETAIVYILPTRQLRLSPFSRMRDPREYTQWAVPAGGYLPDEVTTDEQNQAWAAASMRLNLLKDEFKLLSLTEDDSTDPSEYGRGYARSRLWQEYAGLGRGVCLTFDRQAMIDSVTGQLARYPHAASGRVRYENRRLFEEIFVDLSDAVRGDLDAIAENKIATHLESLFLTKNTEWAGEHEFRFVVHAPTEDEVLVDIHPSLAGICLGPETPPTAFDAIRYFAREIDVPVGKLLWWNNEPMLVGIARD